MLYFVKMVSAIAFACVAGVFVSTKKMLFVWVLTGIGVVGTLAALVEQETASDVDPNLLQQQQWGSGGGGMFGGWFGGSSQQQQQQNQDPLLLMN